MLFFLSRCNAAGVWSNLKSNVAGAEKRWVHILSLAQSSVHIIWFLRSFLSISVLVIHMRGLGYELIYVALDDIEAVGALFWLGIVPMQILT